MKHQHGLVTRASWGLSPRLHEQVLKNSKTTKASLRGIKTFTKPLTLLARVGWGAGKDSRSVRSGISPALANL